MERALRELVDTVQQPYLRQLLKGLIGSESRLGARWREAPAAKHYHQAYRHGLFEHCLSVAQGVHAMAAGPFSAASTTTSRSPARCCTTSARSRPTRRRTARSS